MMMVPFEEKWEAKQARKRNDDVMPEQFYNILLALGKANAFNFKGEIKINGSFIVGSNLDDLLKHFLGFKNIKPKHSGVFENLLKEYGITARSRTKINKTHLLNKGNDKKPFVNETLIESDSDTIIVDWSSSDGEE